MMRARGLRLSGRQVRYRQAGGGGRTVALVHGLGLSSRFWTPHYPALAEAGLHAVAPDLPGFGESPGPGFGMSVEETADWLIAFADALDFDRPAWLGHSLAAQAALALASRSPDRASALILASPVGAPGPLRRTRQAVGLLRDLSRERAALVPAVLREYARTTPAAYLGTWLKAGRDQPLERTGTVRCPTLILVGRHDPIVPDGYVSALRGSIPRANVVRIPDGAHGVAFGHAEAFADEIVRFLTDAG